LQPASVVVLVLTGLALICLVLVEISSRRNARKTQIQESEGKQSPVTQGNK